MNFCRTINLEKNDNHDQMVFCAIYVKGSQFSTHKKYPKLLRGFSEIPLVLMQMRWDGLIGFPGGHVQKGETLHNAIIRETKEEINYDLNINDLTPLCSFTNTDFKVNIHCFCLEVNKDELRQIIESATVCRNFLSENQGCIAVQIANFENGNGYNEFLKNNFKATAKRELEILVHEVLS